MKKGDAFTPLLLNIPLEYFTEGGVQVNQEGLILNSTFQL
jgi:hypothetical protein